MSTYQALLSQKATLDAQAAELAAKLEAARIEEKAGVITQIKELMAGHDVKLSDLGTPRSKSARANTNTKPNKLSGIKVPIKYRGVDKKGDPAAWSGRGLQPKWLREAIALGASLESFEV
jgi:DNA-binding protein H-NS